MVLRIEQFEPVKMAMTYNKIIYRQLIDKYSEVVYTASSDIQFWTTFLPTAIKAYQEKYPNQWRYFESGFYAYDLSGSSNSGWLHGLGKTIDINAGNIDESKNNF